MLNIKASLLRYCELSWASLTQLKTYMGLCKSCFNRFDPEMFASPSLRIAEATSEQGKPLMFVPIENVFLVGAYAVAPNTTQEEAERAGDEIEALVARQASMAGISKILMLVPPNYDGPYADEVKHLRVIERKIPNAISMGGVRLQDTPSAHSYIN